jgi:hypothetical protein
MASGQHHAPDGLPQLPIQQEGGWVPESVRRVSEKTKFSCPLTGLQPRIIHPYLTTRRKEIGGPRWRHSCIVFDGTGAIKPRLNTGYPNREFRDFLQTLHTHAGIISLICLRPVPSTSFPIHFVLIAVNIWHYIICATDSVVKQTRDEIYEGFGIQNYTEQSQHLSPIVLCMLHQRIE